MLKRSCVGILAVVLVVASATLVAWQFSKQGGYLWSWLACNEVIRVEGAKGDVKYDKCSPVAYWQSYAQSPTVGVHQYVEGVFDFHITRLEPPAKKFRTGYAYVRENKLVFADLGNYVSYQAEPGGGYKVVKAHESYSYQAAGYQFGFDSAKGTLSACSRSVADNCETVQVKKQTFPYMYASKGTAVLAVTNYGDALLFKEGRWCRMSMVNDVYSCAMPEPAPLKKPREIQFYSSTVYQGKVLVGEWPTGRLYEFDGTELRPSSMTPPEIAKLAPSRLGYEAQSLAEYCGDLYVGYWPKGEVWRFEHTKGEWELFKRFFSDVNGEAFKPYADRTPDELDPAFFGQRITALVPFEDSLYVATSNLRSWTSSEKIPDFLERRKVAEYGAIYKVTRYGCRTSYASAS